MAQILAKSCHKLTYLNLSRSPKIEGRFLRYLALSCQESPLKTLILRSCPELVSYFLFEVVYRTKDNCNVSLQEKEILEFCNSLLSGNLKSIRHIDVSSRVGLVTDMGRIWSNLNFPLERLKEERSDLTFVAEFPITSLVKCYRVCDEEEMRLIGIMDVEYDEYSDGRR